MSGATKISPDVILYGRVSRIYGNCSGQHSVMNDDTVISVMVSAESDVISDSDNNYLSLILDTFHSQTIQMKLYLDSRNLRLRKTVATLLEIDSQQLTGEVDLTEILAQVKGKTFRAKIKKQATGETEVLQLLPATE